LTVEEHEMNVIGQHQAEGEEFEGQGGSSADGRELPGGHGLILETNRSHYAKYSSSK
jgi:hypothetical protein